MSNQKVQRLDGYRPKYGRRDSPQRVEKRVLGDDVRDAQMKPKVMEGAMKEAAWSLRDNSDQYLAALYTDAGISTDLGTETTGIDVTSVNVVEYMGLVYQKLSEGNVPAETRWMVVPPWSIDKAQVIGNNSPENGQIRGNLKATAQGNPELSQSLVVGKCRD